MKTDRRHELQTNQLADWLSNTIERLQPYTRAILGVILAIVVLLGVWMYLEHESRASVEAGWDEFYAAEGDPNPQKLFDLADRHPMGTPIGDWSRVVLADKQLTDGMNRLFLNKIDANSQLAKAVDYYNAVLPTAKDPMLRQKAVFGLARAYESLNQLDNAKARYKELAEWPDGAFTAIAKQRLEDLNKPATKAWYDWFARQEPRPPVIQGPGTPGQRPAFETAQPGNDIQLQGVGPTNDAGKSESPKSDSPPSSTPTTPATSTSPAGGPAAPPAKSP